MEKDFTAESTEDTEKIYTVKSFYHEDRKTRR